MHTSWVQNEDSQCSDSSTRNTSSSNRTTNYESLVPIICSDSRRWDLCHPSPLIPFPSPIVAMFWYAKLVYLKHPKSNCLLDTALLALSLMLTVRLLISLLCLYIINDVFSKSHRVGTANILVVMRKLARSPMTYLAASLFIYATAIGKEGNNRNWLMPQSACRFSLP